MLISDINMLFSEAMEKSRRIEELRQANIKAKEDGINPEVDKAKVKRLRISYDGMVPDFHQYPNLEWLSVSAPVEPEQINGVCFDNLKELSLCLKKSEKTVILHAPALDKIEIRVDQNEEYNSLPLLTTDYGVIDFSDVPLVRSITLKFVANYKINLPQIDSLLSLGVYNSGSFDSSILENNRQIKSLSIADCDVIGTSFLSHFLFLEKLNLSYNHITVADEVFQLQHLRELDLFRNPLTNPEKYRLSQLERIRINRHDEVVNGFVYAISNAPFDAYMLFRSKRDPDRTPPFFFRLYEKMTDQELFVECL